LLKSLHLQISVKPVTIAFKITENPLDLVVAVLPQIDFKSTGTKCDLEEELITSKLVELPCSSLRACEKTSNKLPWIVDFKGFQIYHYQLEAIERDDFTISLFKNEKKYFFVGNSDSSSIVKKSLPAPLTARAVRIVPFQWVNHISMRAEVYILAP
jgi:hypothetical protein